MGIIENEKDIIQLVENDPWVMKVLLTVRRLELPDWWVCAGFVRSKIWDILHGYETRTPMEDVDVIYFDPSNVNEQEEKKLEQQLGELNPNIPWSVKNQARMHHINGLPPYRSSEEGISKFPETVTALGLKVNVNEEVVLTAPHGIEDVLRMEVHPTPLFKEGKLKDVYIKRVTTKKWKEAWPMVKISY
ncbi:hypothetical protein J2S74_001450 [Evansella vedderi]|uniref:Nucleotidyltransferase family protein n=1 Tax=Evansella vedderi TaxID=38282 RepID=A0ABT9ZS81_9BACI|nr:nucleotidyltransferase family protein [Evansella vedderi]MDQ0254077.1 hypothetical protein [Evansella vedderi]